MAQGGSFFEDVKKELECSVCQEQFSEINEPKILKCLHTFCKNCLEAWLRKRHEGGLSCPTCRQITDCPNNDISRLPSNLFYKQMVEIVEAYGGQAEESPRCGNCEEKKSLKWYCSDCNFFLCDECVVAHRKWKMFSKHQVKEIGSFRSSDLEDYARKANFCKKHKDEARFFCENCQICICRDCAILDHRDHNIFSLEKGLEDKKSEIEAKMRKVQDSGSRLKIHKDSLEKRRLKVNSSIEEATSEVKRVAERCISMIHEHQTSVTEQLVEQKAAFQNAFEAQMTILDTKLMDIDNTLAFCEDVLLRKNLTEILNVKATIEQRLQELSVTSGSEFIPKLDYSQVKYVSNDVSFAPGRLVTTKTESSLSVAEERNRLSEGSVGADGTFTVNAKDSGDQNTYNSVVFPLEENVYDMAPTKISRSIFVAGFPTTTTTEDLIIHFQRKRNGGGNIESIIVSKQGTAVITFDDPEVVTSALQHKQEFNGVILKVEPSCLEMLENDQHFEVFEVVSAELCLTFVEYLSREQTEALLNEITSKTGVRWIKSSESFMLSGTFKQLEESRAFLQQGLHRSSGIVILNEIKGETYRSQKPEDSKSLLDVTASSASPEIQGFEIEPKIVKAFIKAYEKDLNDIEAKYQVEIPRMAEGSKFSLKPKNGCSAEKYDEACNCFISLYQKMYQLVKMERISLKSQLHIIQSRQAISRMGKLFPVSIELSKDRKHWEMYGEASHIEEALKYLKENEGVEIKRETEKSMDENRRRNKTKDNEEDMEVDPPEYSSFMGAKTPGKKLETLLGKVKISVYKGDITNEQVDVIVNAANSDLQHVGGVAKAIVDKGGKKIQQESCAIIRQRGALKDGEVATTNSGNLSCKVIVHAVGPIWNKVGPKNSRKLLRQACISSFAEAERLGMTSIALPAIGSGIYGMPKNICAEVMFGAVDEFIKQGASKKKTLTDIRFVDMDDPSVEAFGKEFLNRYGNNRVGSNSKKAPGEGSDRLSPTGDEGGSSTVSPSRSNRGRCRAKNVPNNSHSTTSPNDPLGVSNTSSSPPASFSSVVKGKLEDNDGRPPEGQERRSDKGKGGFSLPSEGGDGDNKEKETCPICLDTMTNPRSLKCKHVFCSVCLRSALDVSNKCPVCQEPQGALQGNQPRGEMTFRVDRYSVPGYEGYGTIVIHYHFPSGVQGPDHPNPGQYYESTSRVAYLPDTREGRDVLQLLRRAFEARLVFTVGTSNTTGRSNQITGNDIHHKTNLSGGPYRFGYPDPDFLRRVKEELAAKGIR